MNHAGPGAPIFAVIAGPIGAGKSTIINELREEAGFPNRLVVAHEETLTAAVEAMQQAIALRQSIAVETPLLHPDVIALMQLAEERGFEVELVVVGVESVEILQERTRSRAIDDAMMTEMFQRTMHHIPAAIDRAKRVLVIDNSSGAPSIALQLAAGAAIENSRHPSWVVNRVLQPKIEREISREVMRRAFDRTAASAQIKPILQMAKPYIPGNFQGTIIERTDHHVLQQVGHTLHLIHDLALMPYGGLGLAKDVVATISYQIQKGQAFARESENTLDRSLSR